MKLKDTFIAIIFSLLILVIIILSLVNVAIDMQKRIDQLCEKQHNEGIIKFWDADIDCSCKFRSQKLNNYDCNIIK